MKKEALRVTTTIPAAPTTLYYAFLNSEEHSQMTGAPAKVEGIVGGKFTAANGYISGKLVTLDLGRRLVISWRTTDFPRDAHDSRVEIHLEALGGSTRVTLLHTEIPEGQSEKYKSTWNDQYFAPMRAFFSKFLPDPRNPPPPRRPPPPEEDDTAEEEEETPPPKKAPAPKASAKKAPPPPPPKKSAEPPKPAKAEKPPKEEKSEKKKADKPEKSDKKAAKLEKKSDKAEKKADKNKDAKPEKKSKKDKDKGKPKKKK